MARLLSREVVLTGSFSVGEWKITPELNSLERNGHTIRLEPKVMHVLVTLAEHPGAVVSKEQLFRRVWPDTFVTDEVLTRSVSELRKAFEDNPREPTYIQTIPKGGYRLVAPVGGAAPDQNEGSATHKSLRMAWVAAGILGMVLLGTAAFFFVRPAGRLAPQPQITSLAVMPLANLSGDAEQDYFADGMTDELTTRLSSIRALRVVSRTSAMHYKGTGKTPSEIARELNVDALIAGSVVRSGDRVRISAQLIRATNGSNLWAESYERDLRDVLALQAEVARTIADQIRIQATPRERDKLLAAAPVNPEAHDSYLKGLYYWNKFTETGMKRAAAYFEEAIARDPNYAPAYAGLAHAYHELAYYLPPNDVMPKAKRAAMQALQLDETNAEAHAALGWIKSHYDWDWSGAELEYRRALEADPGSVLAHGQYAIYLDTVGRAQEGIEEHKTALQLDPVWLIDMSSLGDSYRFARRYDEAIGQYQKVIEMDPTFADAHAGLGATYLQKGQFREATAHLQQATQLDTDPGFATELAIAYARSSNRKEASAILSRLLAEGAKSYIPSAGIAALYSSMGQQGQSCKWLQRAYEAHDSALAYIHVAPEWDALRSNPCFQDVVGRLGFPQDLGKK